MVTDVFNYIKGLFYLVKTTPVSVTNGSHVKIDFSSQIPTGYTPLLVFQPETNGWVGAPMIYGWYYPNTYAEVYCSVAGTGSIDFWVLCYWTG